MDSKFDLGLISHPQNKSRINNAINTDIFKLLDAQNPQKFGIIPLSDVTLPNEDKQIPLHVNLLDARYAIAKKEKHNLRGGGGFKKYLAAHWDKQLPLLIPLDVYNIIALSHTGNNHPSATPHV